MTFGITRTDYVSPIHLFSAPLMTTFAYFRNHFRWLTPYLVLSCCGAAFVARADLSISNVRAAQRAGTKYVDIYYDLTDDGVGTAQQVSAGLSISSDDGVSFAVPSASLSGTGFGAGQMAGKDKIITWNAGVDWNGKVSPNMRFEVIAALPDDLVMIPAGSFTMGDPTGVGSQDETVHIVQVSAFCIGKYEVTKALWDEVRIWGVNRGYTDLPVGGNGYTALPSAVRPLRPVDAICWYDALKWCNAYSEKSGRTPCYTVSAAVYRTGYVSPDCNWSANGYRLPTESEWEKAARGKQTGKNFPWGNTITHSSANYYSTSDIDYDVSSTRGRHPDYSTISPGENLGYTAPVGSFSANGYGLYDVAGNLLEWCWDSYGPYPVGSVTDPKGSGFATPVLRGGCYAFSASGCRLAARTPWPPNYGYADFGFRLARTSVP